MESTLPRHRGKTRLQSGVALLAIAAIACGLGSSAGWAKHKSHSDPTGDPCQKLNGYMTKRIASIRSLKKDIDKEQSLPNTMEGVFNLMEGKYYVDHAKTEKLGRARKEADDLNRVMRGMGCTPVDIDKELQKPAIAASP
jgi:hypothetical protein